MLKLLIGGLPPIHNFNIPAIWVPPVAQQSFSFCLIIKLARFGAGCNIRMATLYHQLTIGRKNGCRWAIYESIVRFKGVKRPKFLLFQRKIQTHLEFSNFTLFNHTTGASPHRLAKGQDGQRIRINPVCIYSSLLHTCTLCNGHWTMN